MAAPAVIGDLGSNRFLFWLAVAASVNAVAGKPLPWIVFIGVGLLAIGEQSGFTDVVPEEWEKRLYITR